MSTRFFSTPVANAIAKRRPFEVDPEAQNDLEGYMEMKMNLTMREALVMMQIAGRTHIRNSDFRAVMDPAPVLEGLRSSASTAPAAAAAKTNGDDGKKMVDLKALAEAPLERPELPLKLSQTCIFQGEELAVETLDMQQIIARPRKRARPGKEFQVDAVGLIPADCILSEEMHAFLDRLIVEFSAVGDSHRPEVFNAILERLKKDSQLGLLCPYILAFVDCRLRPKPKCDERQVSGLLKLIVALLENPNHSLFGHLRLVIRAAFCVCLAPQTHLSPNVRREAAALLLSCAQKFENRCAKLRESMLDVFKTAFSLELKAAKEDPAQKGAGGAVLEGRFSTCLGAMECAAIFGADAVVPLVDAVKEIDPGFTSMRNKLPQQFGQVLTTLLKRSETVAAQSKSKSV